MQGRLLLSLGLLGLANCQQQQQPAMALERRDICLVSCGQGWCCVSGQKCIAGPSKDFSTPYGCEDEILGFHTTWEAYRGDFKEWTSTTYTHKPEPTPNGPPVDIINAANTITPPSSTPTTNAPQPAKTTVVPASAGRLNLGNSIAGIGFLATFMGFLMA